MLLLRSALFNLLLYLWIVLFGVALAPFLWLPRPRLFSLLRIWSGGIALLLRWVCGLTYEVRGRERLPKGPFLLAPKHQSAWETLMIAHLVEQPVIIYKRELLWLPVLGWYLKGLKMIAVDRRAGGAALKTMLRQARLRVAEGRPVVIFPEGTRTAPGQRKRYQSGVFALYRELRLPVVPAALNSGCFWGRRSFIRRPGRIVVSFLQPLPPGLPRESFLPRLEEAIEEESLRLAAAVEGCLGRREAERATEAGSRP